ncbi:LTA synthase family protein [Oryzicola mucosus]|uniref:Sulfatase n=1 Tax=Oryzicola mucosus TaxID=2767425 RepID=A0A8J6PWB3_9HYPH|nr:sulfatase [Oryzicola mucosus]MBD0415298.1 sulfatase [Oryzicola mucosus]
MPDKTAPTASRQTWLALILFLMLGLLALALPDHPDAITPRAFLRLPLELPLIIFVLLLMPQRLAPAAAAVLTAAFLLTLILKIADIATQAAFQRPFNPYLDAKMASDGWNVLSGSMGAVQAGLAFGGALFLVAMVTAGLFWSLRSLALTPRPARRKLRVLFGLVATAGSVILIAGFSFADRVNARSVNYLSTRLDLISRSIADIRAFEEELVKETGPANGQGLFGAVAGRDVVLIFIESYGRSAVEDPRYAKTTLPRLHSIEQRLSETRLHAASGWLGAPTVGGLSWLAHGTFLSGLWIENQARYDLLMRSKRPSLNRLFSAAGWESIAIMPAITMAWPEAAYYGYDRVFAAADLGYRGQPFNWITMPDQYTLSTFERVARSPSRAAGKPVMAEIALISSHAPWTPVPQLVGWEDVGDGTIFNAQAVAGDPPAVVWSDPERVRQHYIATIDYSLSAVGDYITRFGGDALFIVVGDHQPASIITGPNASRDVPIHIISRESELIQRFQTNGFSGGLLPLRETRARPMSDMHALLIDLLAKQ